VSVESVTAHLGSEQHEILQYILRRHNTTRMLMRRSGLIERRVQRRLRELLERGWIEQIDVRIDGCARHRIFQVTEEGLRNVPSTAEGSTVRG